MMFSREFAKCALDLVVSGRLRHAKRFVVIPELHCHWSNFFACRARRNSYVAVASFRIVEQHASMRDFGKSLVIIGLVALWSVSFSGAV